MKSKNHSLLRQCHFETLWISYQPNTLNFFQFNSQLNVQDAHVPAKIDCLYSRGAYVVKLSHKADLIALACNQKFVARNSLVFMSVSNGTVFPVNLRAFGLGNGAKGRHYWIQELDWLCNDLYLAGITKHGAVFIVSRLGHPLAIHALGKDINMGPALYISLHPLILVRGKSSNNLTTGEISLSSTIENEDSLRQRYSISSHPTLPVVVCSDGYLVCIFRLQSSFATQSRLIRELMHETIGLLNSASDDLNNNRTATGTYARLENPFNKSVAKSRLVKKRDLSNHDDNDNDEDGDERKLPDWGLQTAPTTLVQSDNNNNKSNSDSGVEANDGVGQQREMKKAAKFQGHKIAEGKIIFSYLPEIVPVSFEMLQTGSVAAKMEHAFEYLQSSWTLLVSLSTREASQNIYECDQTAKSIQQSFGHFAYLFLTLDSASLREFQVYKQEFESRQQQQQQPSNQLVRRESKPSAEEEEFKIKLLVDLFIRMLKFLYFDPASKHNPNSHVIIYVPRFVEKFMQSILKFDSLLINDSKYSKSKTNLLSLIFNLLNFSESLLKSIYKFRQADNFSLSVDSVLGQKEDAKPGIESSSGGSSKKKQPSAKVEPDSLNGTTTTVEDPNETRTTRSVVADDEPSTSSLQSIVDADKNRALSFVDLLFEKSWNNLMHYAKKQRKLLNSMGKNRERQLKELDMLIILVERRLESFPANINSNIVNDSLLSNRLPDALQLKLKKLKFDTIQKRAQLFRINKADLVYLDLGNVELSIQLWTSQLESLFDQLDQLKLSIHQQPSSGAKLSHLIQKSVKIAHKILYACLVNYDLERLISIFNKHFEYESNGFSPFSLMANTFRHLRPPKPLKRTSLAVVCALKSLARFMALYFINNNLKKPLFVYSINNPQMMPNIMCETERQLCPVDHKVRIELSREKLTASISKSTMASFFTTDKTLELLIVTGLYDEAIYFANLINDWKISFFISSMLK